MELYETVKTVRQWAVSRVSFSRRDVRKGLSR